MIRSRPQPSRPSFTRRLRWPRIWRVSLSAAPFYASLLVILALTLFIGIFWAINEYQAYRESIDNIRRNYQEQYTNRAREELQSVFSYIRQARAQASSAAETELRKRVQSAYTTVSHLYNLYKDAHELSAIRTMAIELLRPIRWFDGKGYYFAGQTRPGIIDLFADDPYFEGRRHLTRQQQNEPDPLDSIINLVLSRGAGSYRFDLVKPAFPGHRQTQICFVKHFPTLDWFLGAAVYADSFQSVNQETILNRINNTSFGGDGEFFVFRSDGTIVSHRNRQLVGSNIASTGFGDTSFGQALLETTTGNKRERSFTTYLQGADDGTVAAARLCYVKHYPDWDWNVAALISMSEMDKLVAEATRTYRSIAFKNVYTFIALFLAAVIMLLLITYYYTVKIKQGFSLFTDFFRRAADSQVKINHRELAFREFEDLAVLANHMVDDRLRKQRLIHRDEQRLDTLLQLGMMERHSIKEKFRFTLQRLIEITGSAEGYLALVNRPQDRLAIVAHFDSDGRAISYPDRRQLSKAVADGGFPGLAVLRKNAIISNTTVEAGQSDCFPYRQKVRRHLEVPLFNDGLIVLVAGVCNNHNDYYKSDIRQVTMLLEGMWLHILKTRSERKLARLERTVIIARESERSNIGRLLHDDLGSHLSGIELLSKALKISLEKELPARADQLETIRKQLVDATEKTRRLARGLYPVHIIEDGLEAAIEELVQELQNLHGISCPLSFAGQLEYIDNNTATHVYYIVREAAINAARHGNPKTIDITVTVEENYLQAKITDDGCGFEPRWGRKGMGLHTMEYRAKAIGASFVLDAGRNRGTTVTITKER